MLSLPCSDSETEELLNLAEYFERNPEVADDAGRLVPGSEGAVDADLFSLHWSYLSG